MPSKNISAIVSFSRELRNAREFRSISLTDVATATKIETEHLEAIESAHWDTIPEGFLRGYIASYATAVGMNREKVLRDFDSLMSPQEGESIAQIVKNNPLLKQPERVGLTRAKIAAAWFAELTTKTHLKPILLILAVFAILVGPVWMRNSLRVTPPEPIPISRIVKEYQSKTHGPRTVIPLDQLDKGEGDSSVPGHWLGIKTVDSGHLRFLTDLQTSNSLSYSLLEDINIQFLKSITVEVSPPNSAYICLADSALCLDSTMTTQTAFYTCAFPNSVPNPLTADSVDSSLGH